MQGLPAWQCGCCLKCATTHSGIVQAANVEAYVTQTPQQGPAACHARSGHSRTLADIEAAAVALEPAPPAVVQLDCAQFCGEDAPPPLPPADPAANGVDSEGQQAADGHAAPAPKSKRKFAEDPSVLSKHTETGKLAKHTEDDRGGVISSNHVATATDSNSKDANAMSDVDLLAAIDETLTARAGAKPSSAVGKSRWEAASDSEDGFDDAKPIAPPGKNNVLGAFLPHICCIQCVSSASPALHQTISKPYMLLHAYWPDGFMRAIM